MNAPIYNRQNEIPSDGWYQIEVTGVHSVDDGCQQVIIKQAIFALIQKQMGASWSQFEGACR